MSKEEELSEQQQEMLKRAREYAASIQTELLLLCSAEPSLGLAPSVPGLKSLPAGIDARSLSILCRIYVGSIPFDYAEQQVAQLFSQFGAVKEVSMSYDHLMKRHKGFGFVEFENPEAAKLAIEGLQGAEVSGR